MQDGTIGRRYARALALALDESGAADALPAVEAQLSQLGALLAKGGHADLREVMLNPSFTLEERRAVLAEVAESYSFHISLATLLTLLIDKDRIDMLPAIARAFASEVDERLGRVRAQIRSAAPVDDTVLATLLQVLERKTGKKVLPEVSVDPSLLGGISTRIGGQVFDNTVRGQLDRIRSNLGVA